MELCLNYYLKYRLLSQLHVKVQKILLLVLFFIFFSNFFFFFQTFYSHNFTFSWHFSFLCDFHTVAENIHDTEKESLGIYPALDRCMMSALLRCLSRPCHSDDTGISTRNKSPPLSVTYNGYSECTFSSRAIMMFPLWSVHPPQRVYKFEKKRKNKTMRYPT